MARLPTTTDVFNAVAEPQRRVIINLLARNEKSVNEIAEALDLRQPQTSKHLRVLKEVGLVTVRGAGRQRLYKLNSAELKPIYDWVQSFEHLWNERFDRLDAYLEQLQKAD
ncbi:MAG: metalloregulator ArsR/SmtB family transcription factor [Candidatus Promineifilaceae bacterium]